MVLFIILLIMLLLLAVFVIGTIGTVGAIGTIVLSDVIVCMIFIVIIMRWLIKRRR